MHRTCSIQRGNLFHAAGTADSRRGRNVGAKVPTVVLRQPQKTIQNIDAENCHICQSPGQFCVTAHGHDVNCRRGLKCGRSSLELRDVVKRAIAICDEHYLAAGGV